jgi:iron complex outermembrane receptor protein
MTKLNKGGVRLSSTAPMSSRNSATLWRWLGGASTAALSVAIWLPAGAAFAQPASGPPEANAPLAPVTQEPAATKGGTGAQVQEVIVTGSRIARRDFTSNSPIITLNSQVLMNQADLQIQNTLNKLPQFSPDQNLMGNANTGDVQPTPTHSIGIATASLRGLGPNRNLVLVDGRRAAPVNGQLVVDLNTIPASMIDRVETITGGASAVYGADAVGGVVNFIMKKNFQGMDLDVQDSINQTGDGNQFQASALFGTNFQDDRGNLTVSLERFQQDASLQSKHSFYTKGWANPTMGGNSLFGFGSGWNTGANGPSAAAVAAVFPNATGPITPNFTQFWVQGNSVYTGLQGLFGANNPGGAYKNPNAINNTSTAYVNVIDPVTHQVVQDVKTNQTNAYIQAPLDRWSMFTNGHYDINDDVTAFFQADFSRTHTDTVLSAPVSIITGWNALIPYDSATNGAASGHPVPTQLATLLNSRANPNAPWELYWVPSPNGPLPPRGAEANNTVYQIVAGLDGKVRRTDWTWELYGSHSESQEYTIARGDYSLTRFQDMLLAPGTTWGAGASITGNQTQPNGIGGTMASPAPGFGAATATCSSGFYNTIFNGAPLSKDCLAAISAPLQSMNITRQDVVEFDIQGGLFQLPAGQLRFSAGADYRRDSLEYNPDILQSSNSFADQVIGVYPTPYTNAAQDVKEGYGELSIPVLANLPLIKSFTLNPGVRYSAYSASDGGFTYKMLADWQVDNFVRFRGGYNLAVRAPNLGELFQGKTEEYTGPGTSYGDACSLLSTAPFGAGGAGVALGQTSPSAVVNAGGVAGAQNALALCKALMGQAAAQSYYANTQPNPGPAGLAFVNVQGSPTLQPEEAKTYTAGVVLRSPFQSPVFNRATLSIDWYKIHIDHAIEYASIDYVYQNCLNQPASTPSQIAAALNSPFCQAVQRAPGTGISGTTTTPDANLATIDTSGVDVQFDWAIPLSDLAKSIPGTFSLSVVSSFLGNYDTTAAPGLPVQHWYGTLGPTLTGTNPGSYAYKLNTNFGYALGPAVIGINWRHLPSVHSANAVAAGNLYLDTPAYDVFDLNTNWSLPHGLQLRAGIQNLFDVNPLNTGAQNGLSINGIPTALATNGQGGPTTNTGFYDPLGRRFYLGLKARF